MDENVGGIVLFVGTVRNQTDGRRVKGLEYQVYRRMAQREIAKLEEEIKRRWPVKSITLVHREGKLKVGDVSVVVAVSAPHRGEAFDAARYAIDRIKDSLPIWKREKLKGGRYAWVKGTPIQRNSPSASKEGGPENRVRGIVHQRTRSLELVKTVIDSVCPTTGRAWRPSAFLSRFT
jgi:molybdopterin synthase catalytic subunit